MTNTVAKRTNPKVAILVLGYNNHNYLEDCFKSVQELKYQNKVVYFIDNNSSDSSISLVKDKFPSVKIIINKANYGFAKGNNIGIATALDDHCDVIMLLNPDTIVDQDCLSELVDNYAPNTILQPLVLLFDKGKTEKVNTSGNHLQFLGVSYCNELNVDKSQIVEKEIASASGSAMFVPKEIIERVGLLDEDFFMYNEDLDFCWRARILGFHIKLIPKGLVWHKYKFTKNKQKYYYIEKNRLLFLLKNYQLSTLLLIFPALVIHEVSATVLSLIGGWFVQKIRSYLMFLYQLPSILRKRLGVRRVKSDYELSNFISYKVNFALVSLPGVFIYNKLMGIYWGLVKCILRNLS